MNRLAQAAAMLVAIIPSAKADDWPAWGRDLTRNAVSPEKGAPLDFAFENHGEKPVRAKNVQWSARAGTRVVGSPVIVGGLVWVGTNNVVDYRDRTRPDASVLLCLRASDGKEIYRY